MMPRRAASFDRARRSGAGFTLLEVLVAATIMAIAVSGLLANLSTSMRVAARLGDYDRATLLARQKMDELLVNMKTPRSAPFQGNWDPALTSGLICGWQAVVQPWDVPSGAVVGTPVLDRIDLTVWWVANNQRRSFRFEGYRRGIVTPQDVAAGLPPPIQQ